VCCDRLLDVAGRACSDETHKALLFHTSNRLLGIAANATAATRNSTDGHVSAAAASRHFTTESSKQLTVNTLKPVATVNTPIMSESRLHVVHLRPSVSSESLLPVPVHGRLSPLPPLSSSAQLTAMTVRQSWGPTSRSEDHISLPGTLTAAGRSGTSPAERVAVAMSCTEYAPEALAKVDGYKLKLNSSQVEWKRLSVENDPHVLSALMWDWIDELKVRQLHLLQQ